MGTSIGVQPKRPRRERILYTAIALVIAMLALDGVFGAHGLIAAYRLKLKVNQEQQKIQQLNEENREFSEQVQALKSDPSAIERVARQRMGLVKPGELVFKLPLKPSTDQTLSPAVRPGTAPQR